MHFLEVKAWLSILDGCSVTTVYDSSVTRYMPQCLAS